MSNSKASWQNDVLKAIFREPVPAPQMDAGKGQSLQFGAEPLKVQGQQTRQLQLG